MRDSDVEVLFDARAQLGEGPCWDKERRALFWVDIVGGTVHAYEPDTGKQKSVRMSMYVSSIVPRKSGNAVVTLQHGFYDLDFETGRVSPIAEVEKDLADNRFNDGKCDALGRFQAVTMNMRGTRPTGALYCLEENHSLRKVLSNVTTFNGPAWSPDNRIMFYTDTHTKKVSEFDYDLTSGRIRNRQIVIDLSDQSSSPDGMAVDEEGMIWLAQWGGSRISRWNPSTRETIDRVMIPASLVTSCCFGGKNFDELYITTARMGLHEKELSEQPHSGGLFRARVKVRGLCANYFDGQKP